MMPSSPVIQIVLADDHVRGQADGQDILMLLGNQRLRAEALTTSAASGSIHISPETCELVSGAISDELGSCVVMAEFAPTSPSAARPPKRNAGCASR